MTDLAAVAAEPYAQWVIEDDFPGGRPAWEQAGAVLTDDAGPWERLKLRALNGVHSAIAYLGALAGRETIADALALPAPGDVLRRLIAEDVARQLHPAGRGRRDRLRRAGAGPVRQPGDPAPHPPGGDGRLAEAAAAGPAHHRRPARGRAGPRAGARWSWPPGCASLLGYADDGRPLPLDDPLADPIRAALAAGAQTPAGAVDAVFALREVFPAEVAEDDEVRADVTGWLTALERHGVRRPWPVPGDRVDAGRRR